MNYLEYRFDVLPSTQDFLREKRGEGQDMLAVAVKQSGGKGTNDRSYECAKGGLWLSYLHFHQDTPARDAFLMMARAAVAVCKTLEEYGLTPQIKWANDVLVGGKKVCGVLTENVLSGDKITSTLWGIGINANNPLSASISGFATTLSACLKGYVAVAPLERRLLFHLMNEFTFEEYKNRLAFLGEEVAFVQGEKRFAATFLGVTDCGEVLLEIDGQQRRFAYGEIAFAKKDERE